MLWDVSKSRPIYLDRDNKMSFTAKGDMAIRVPLAPERISTLSYMDTANSVPVYPIPHIAIPIAVHRAAATMILTITSDQIRLTNSSNLPHLAMATVRYTLLYKAVANLILTIVVILRLLKEAAVTLVPQRSTNPTCPTRCQVQAFRVPSSSSDHSKHDGSRLRSW